MYCSRLRVLEMSSDLNRNFEQRDVMGSMILDAGQWESPSMPPYLVT